MQQLRFYSSQWLTLHVSGDSLTISLHNDRTTLLLTNLQPKWASLPVAIYSLCTPDDGCDCYPKHVELAIAKNKNAIVASCWTYLLLYSRQIYVRAVNVKDIEAYEIIKNVLRTERPGNWSSIPEKSEISIPSTPCRPALGPCSFVSSGEFFQ